MKEQGPEAHPGKRIVLWLILWGSLLASLYCFSGYAMVASLSATPGYSRERALFWAQIGGGGTLAFLLVAILSAACLFREFRKMRLHANALRQ